MKINLLLAATFISFIALAQPAAARNEPNRTASSPGSAPIEVTVTAETSVTSSSAGIKSRGPVSSGEKDLPGQERPQKAKGKESGKEPKKEKQEIKEVATAKRQEKPEKVSGASRGSAARPQSAARPGRGAASSVLKATGNATKAVKAVKPVKVGVGPIKVGKN